MAEKNTDTLVTEHEVKIKGLEKRMAKVEETSSQISKLTVSIEKMATVQTQMLEEQKELKEDLKSLKDQPAKDAHDMKQKVVLSIITTILGLIIGALFALILK